MKPFRSFCSNMYLFSGLLFIFLLMQSCDRNNSDPAPSNEITLSSETFGTQPYYSMGYSFENQVYLKRISSGSGIDIYLNEMLNPAGNLLGVQFSTNTISETTFGYYLNEESGTLSEAESFYNNYSQIVFPVYESLTDTIRPFQVYTFKTWKANYVKFIVKDVRTIYSSDFADFMEVDIEYFIQRDGAAIFSE